MLLQKKLERGAFCGKEMPGVLGGLSAAGSECSASECWASGGAWSSVCQWLPEAEVESTEAIASGGLGSLLFRARAQV